MVASDPQVRWRIVVGLLNIHSSASLVYWVAAESDLDVDLGKKGKSGILRNRHTRTAFLQEPTHRIVFHYTPKHSSWLNQIELWLSILLCRASLTSVADLVAQGRAFVDYYDRTMAKPFRWTYQGKPLVA